MMGLFLAGLLLVPSITPVPATPAKDIYVAELLTRAAEVNALGLQAAQSPQFKALKADIAAITRSYRNDLAAQEKNGQSPDSCPPTKIPLSSRELMAELNAVPHNQKATITVKSVFAGLMRKHYPCSVR